MALSPYLFYLLIFTGVCYSWRSKIDDGSRLPKNVIPQSYSIDLEIDPPEYYRSYGSVSILGNVLSDTDIITLHSGSDVEITKISVKTLTNNEDIFKSSNHTSEDWGVMNLYLTDMLKKNEQFKITIRFFSRSNFNEGLMSRRIDREDGTKELFVGKGFEIGSTRNAFPCFDDPEYKTNFSLIIRHPEDYKVVSSMGVDSIEYIDEKWRRTTFKTSPKMSAYSLGFFVSRFSSINNQNDATSIYHKLIEVYYDNSTNSIEDAKFVLETSQKCMNLMEKYLEFEYRLPKMSLFIAPNFNYESYRIETWGVIPFDFDDFLNNKKCYETCKRKMTMEICRKIARMWFGNEITMDWWNSLWITEGFAIHFQYKLAAMIYEDEEYFNELFYKDIILDGLLRDYFDPSLIVPNLEDYWQTQEYSLPSFTRKSAVIVRMFEEMIGKPAFQRAMQNFIKKFSGSVVTSKDLLNEFRMSSNLNIPDEMIDSWIKNRGHPLITAIQRDNSFIIDLYQAIDFSNPDERNEKWYIPLNWATKTNPDFNDTTAKMWMKPNENITIELKNENDWFILNKNSMGFYRTHYDFKNWMKIDHLLNQKNFGGIDAFNRALIINNLFNLTSSEQDFTTALEVLKYLKMETEELPWSSGYKIISIFWTYFHQLENHQKLNDFVENLIGPLLNTIDVKSKDGTISDRDELILSLGCGFKIELALSLWNELLEKIIKSPDAKLDKRESIFCASAKASEEQFDFLIQHYSDEKNEYRRDLILRALTLVDNEAVVKKFYGMMLVEETSQNVINGSTIFNLVSMEKPPITKYFTDFLLENFQQLYSIYGFDKMKTLMETMENIPPREMQSIRTFIDSLYEKYKSSLSNEMLSIIEKVKTQIVDKLNNPKKDESIIDFDEALSKFTYI